jgi:hypothetical protein
MRITSVLLCVSIPIVGLLAMSTAALSQQAAAPKRAAPSAKTVRRIVDEIGLIQGMPPKSGEPQTDPHARAIMELGKAAGPGLAEKLTDTSPSQVANLYRSAIGDVALVLLTEIYKPPSWPFPDGSFKLPEKYGDYRDYVEFVNSHGARKRLQRSWRSFVQRQSPPAK